jgi:protease I
MASTLKGKKVAILVTDGFEQAEMTEPRRALDDAGARTVLITPKGAAVKGMKHKDPGDTFKADMSLSDAKAEDFDALVLPGGVANPDALRILPEVQTFVGAFGRAKKPIAAICHGPWSLIDAGLVRGKRLTSWPSLKSDLTNAGASWVDEEVVVDGALITSRKPDDIPAFNRALASALQGNGASTAVSGGRSESRGGAR